MKMASKFIKVHYVWFDALLRVFNPVPLSYLLGSGFIAGFTVTAFQPCLGYTNQGRNTARTCPKTSVPFRSCDARRNESEHDDIHWINETACSVTAKLVICVVDIVDWISCPETVRSSKMSNHFQS